MAVLHLVRSVTTQTGNLTLHYLRRPRSLRRNGLTVDLEKTGVLQVGEY